MRPVVVVGVLWTLACVALVGYLAGLVALRLNESDWSHVDTPTRDSPSCVRGYRLTCP